MTKFEALKQIAAEVGRCFGDVNLEFRSGVAGEGSASGLKSLAQRWGLSREEIQTAIFPSLQDWLDHGYTGFGENRSRPWHHDDVKRRSKAHSMAIEAAWYFANH